MSDNTMRITELYAIVTSQIAGEIYESKKRLSIFFGFVLILGLIYSEAIIIVLALIAVGLSSLFRGDWESFYVSIIFIGLIGIPVWISLLLYRSFSRHKKFLEDVQTIYILTKESFNTEESIEKILDITNRTYAVIYRHSTYTKRFNSHKLLHKKKIYMNQILYFHFLLSDFRSDLSIRIAEQRKTLESVKSEVTKQLSGTTELAQVSEAQKRRLDKQIEQFEELQRVLVKV